MNKKLRLLLFKDCNRNCLGCCNKDWDLDNLPIATSFSGFNEILLTGGEPMLKPDVIVGTIVRIKKENPKAKIFMYTQKLDYTNTLIHILDHYLDGITITLHSRSDIKPFEYFVELCPRYLLESRSMRLNVFKGIPVPLCAQGLFRIKSKMTWIKDCPLPDGEVFQRL